MAAPLWQRVAEAILQSLTRASRQQPGATTVARPRATPRPDQPGTPAPGAADYPGDFTGRPELSYLPRDDNDADPGEVVWTWVPYEEDHSQGKDRPVLVIGQDDGWLLALPMTSKDHDRDADQEASAGRYWHDIGTGPWDRSGRASEVRVNRIVRVYPEKVRRVAARLDEARFAGVRQAVLEHF